MGALGLSNDSGKTRHTLPHPPVSVVISLTLEAAIAEAWRRIHLEPRPRFNSVTALEVNFTAELHEVLRDELLEEESVAGFTKDIFHDVERPEVKNFDGTKLSLRPDMLVKLVGRENVKPTQDGIFVEAKLVYKSNSSKHRYCGSGITRFNDGDYAWAMTEAMMLGYSRESQKPSHALTTGFDAPDVKVIVFARPVRSSIALR